MKNALHVLTFASAIMFLTSAAYANPQTGAPTPTPNTPSATSGNTSTSMSGTHERHGPCKADVQNFCGNVPKGGGRILACLNEHEGQLSQRCEAAMQRHAAKQGGAASTKPAVSPNTAPPPVK